MPSEVSGGMAKRNGIARAIAMGPESVMYDEPFSGLDPISLRVGALLIKIWHLHPFHTNAWRFPMNWRSGCVIC